MTYLGTKMQHKTRNHYPINNDIIISSKKTEIKLLSNAKKKHFFKVLFNLLCLTLVTVPACLLSL